MPGVKVPELGLGRAAGQTAARRAAAMRILVLGDFRARSDGEAVTGPAIVDRPVVRIDVDDLDDVLRRLSPRLRILGSEGEGARELEFRSFDDFRPEALAARVPALRRLLDIRRRLLAPEGFEGAAEELQALLGSALPPTDAAAGGAAPATQTPPAESDAETIERLLGEPAGRGAKGSGSAGTVQAAVRRLIERAVAPHLVSGQPPHREVYLRALDEALGEGLRAQLHAPGFQALEARWLGLHQLVTNLETNEELQVHLLDVSQQELAADLAAAGGDLKASGLYRLLVEHTGPDTPGGEPWSLLAGAFELGPTPEDLGLVAAMGLIGASAGGPFIAAAAPGLLGCRSLAATPDPSAWGRLPAQTEAAWQELRESPIAPWVGLALPRVLLRLPYGKGAEPAEGFEFEELGTERRHEDYLWGSPALVCARLIGQAFSARGWDMAPGDLQDVGDLPAHVFLEAGEKRLQACAETYLTERAANAILDRGIMPLLSFRGRNLVRVARFQSIASPPAALMGSWQG